MSPSSKCFCQKHVAFTPRHFQLKGAGFKNAMKRSFKGNREAWDKFLEPAVNTLAPVIGMAVGAKSKNPQVGQATTYILMSITKGKVLSLTDFHVNGLRLRNI